MEIRTNQENYIRAAKRITTAYLFLLFCGLPLVFWRMYFDITETKLAFFYGASLLYLLLLLLARLFHPLDYGTKPERIRMHPAAIALLALALCFGVGSALGGHPEEAAWGQNNRYQGVFTLLLYAAVVFGLSQQSIDPLPPARALAIGAVPVCLLGALNHFGVDPFGFTVNLSALDKGRFLSTLGNADFYGSYLCMAVPVVAGLFLQAKRPSARVLSGLMLVCACFGVLVAGSDSTALGLFAATLLFPLALFSDLRALRRYFLALAVFSLCAFVFGMLRHGLPSATYLSGFALLLSSPAVSGAMFAFFALLWLFLQNASPVGLRRFSRFYRIALGAAVLLGIAALVLLNTVLSDLPLGGAEHYLRFSASWGTDRGKIWMFVFRLYRSYPVPQILFGAGPGALFHADAASRVFADAALDTAHNEYLQYLLVSGALGLAAYLAALGFALSAGIRKCASHPEYRGLVVALAAYAAQATVNIAQPMSTPLAFLLIGVLISQGHGQAQANMPAELEK
ncbi:MAG: O-antigen ligase family protein [Eubacteriales bacterium]|nr:O-antigen ligase family protein [Eubacteriales bacterium]